MTYPEFDEPCPTYIKGYVEWKLRREEHRKVRWKAQQVDRIFAIGNDIRIQLEYLERREE